MIDVAVLAYFADLTGDKISEKNYARILYAICYVNIRKWDTKQLGLNEIELQNR